MTDFPAPPSAADAIARAGVLVNAAAIAVNSTDIQSMTGNTVFVSSASDLPAPVGGIITLPGNFTYYLTENVNISPNRIVGEARVMFRSRSNNLKLETDNVLPLITWRGDFQSDTIRFVNTSGPCFDYDSLGTPGVDFSELKILNTNINSFGRDKFGSSAPTILQSIEFNQDYDGIEFPGIYPFGVKITDVDFLVPIGPTPTTFITFPAGMIAGVIDIRNCLFEISNPATTAINFDAGAQTNNVSSISGCKAIGAGTPLVGNISSDNVFWNFSGNDSTSGVLRDSEVQGSVQYINNSQLTSIATAGVWYDIESDVSYTESALDERVALEPKALPNPGAAKFIGLESSKVTLTLIVTVDRPGNNAERDYMMRVIHNGVPLADSEFLVSYRNVRQSWPWSAPALAATGDEFQLQIRQEVGLAERDLLIVSSQIIIAG